MNKYLILFLCCLSVKLFAHGGEDHGDKKETVKPGVTYFTINSASDVFEMVLRYEPLEKNQDAHLKLFVSDFETNAPVDSAAIEVTSPDDDKLKFTVKQIERGTYIIEGVFSENKKYSLIANISAGDNADLMTLEGIEVGKKLPSIKEEEQKKASFFSWQTLFVFIGGMVFCFIITLFIFRKKRIDIQH